MTAMCLHKLKFSLTVITLQVIFVVLFALLVDYDSSASPKMFPKKGAKLTASADEGTDLHSYYPMFQDVHVMIFIGFGFLMMFLRRYGFSSVGLNMLLAALCIQWATIVGGLVHYKGEKFHVSIVNMLTADFACAAVLITFGALLGKTSPLQMVVIAIFEIVLFAVNEYIGLEVLHTVDVGGSMFVHAFGAYFGLSCSLVLHNPEVENSKKEGSVYHSDMFAMVGTIFLWLFWPSFNSALAVEDAQHRAVLNTYFALAACCVVTFAVSSLVDGGGKFDMVHVQNATLAGGVAVGTSADMMVEPYGALLIGSVAGLISVIGYKYITPFLSSKLKIHDTCGVNNLHGMPAIMAGIVGAIMVSLADKETYGTTLYRQFPAMAPKNASSPELLELKGLMEASPGEGRTAGEQASYQMAALVVTLAIAIVGGLLVGVLIRLCSFLGKPTPTNLFDDTPSWHVPDDEEIMAPIISTLVQAELQKGVFRPDDSDLPLLHRKGDDSFRA